MSKYDHHCVVCNKGLTEDEAHSYTVYDGLNYFCREHCEGRRDGTCTKCDEEEEEMSEPKPRYTAATNSELDTMLQPGQKLAISFGEGKLGNRTIHIRAIVDGGFFVFRWWKKGGWEYAIKDREYFELLHESGKLIKKK